MKSKYVLCTVKSKRELIEEVEELMGYGYKPQGGVSVSIDAHGNTYYVQAMLKEPTKEQLERLNSRG